MFKRKEDEELLREAIRTPNYQYGKEQSAPLSDSRWKNESQYNMHSVDEDFMSKMQDAERRGDLASAAYWERARNEKIGLGYGGQYSPTYKYNYNPSENRAMADDIRTKLMEYDKFDYDPQNDAAYKALTNVYQRNAKAASENALARAAAANGGRLSSNAIIAANLGYQDKMAGLEAEIPALREAAYNMYRNEKNDLRQLGYDYANAEDVNYNRWVDNYNRMYTGTMDNLNIERTNRLDEQTEKQNKFANEYDLSKNLGYVTYNLGQMTGITPGVPWASEVNVATQNAIALSQNLGYVTGALSALTGIPEGTPFESAKQFMDTSQYNIQSDTGQFSPEWLRSHGINPESINTTPRATTASQTTSAPQTPSAPQTTVADSDSNSGGDINAAYNELMSMSDITPENVMEKVNEIAKRYGLSEEQQIQLLNSIG